MTTRLRLLLIIPGAAFLIAVVAFEFGLRKGRETSPAADRGSESPARVTDERLVELLLAQDLGERRFAFAEVVSASSGHRILPADRGDPAMGTILDAIDEAASRSLVLLNAGDSPVRSLRRINEASRYFEDALRTFIDAHPDLACSVPTTTDGTTQRSGYPDLRIEHVPSGRVAYLDPKLFEETSRSSSLRTFYYEPKARSSKIREDASHLLLGISHDGKDGAWTFTGTELIDLSRLQVRLKAEFQASNRELYPPE